MIPRLTIIIAALTLTGCGAGIFSVTRPDGTVINGAWCHVVADPTITGASIESPQGKVRLDGFHSEAKMTAMDLLQTAAAMAKQGIKP